MNWLQTDNSMKEEFIPVNTPILGLEERKNVIECVESGWISSEGPFVSAFEEQFASKVNRKFGIAVSSGSAALDIVLKAMDITEGHEVIVPTFTIISPVQSILNTGATPVLVDSDPDTWNMDVNQIEGKITSRTKAILVVHIYGLPVNMDPVIDLCDRYGLLLIEDAAQMHGQTYKSNPCGSFGAASTFSFYPNKHITTGEGGMIVTNDPNLKEKCLKLRNLSFEPKGRRFVHHEIGWNYRMSNLHAGIGLAQLNSLDDIIAKKREIGNRYQIKLEGLPGVQLPIMNTEYASNIFWVFGVVASSEDLANEMSSYLNNNRIGTRPFFWCMHEQPVFKKMKLFTDQSFPVAEKLSRQGFYLPSGLGLKEKEQTRVIEIIKHFALKISDSN